MTDAFDENELLAYVEGELSPPRRRALEARLSAAPTLGADLDGMARDRRTMRALGEPELPRDLVTELEPQLARPMLMDPVVGSDAAARGAYRRRQARRRRIADAPRLFRRLAVAAVLLGAVSAGTWAILRFGPDAVRRGMPVANTDRVDSDEGRAVPNVVESGTPTSPDAWPPSDALVHHWRPVPGELAVPETIADVPASTGPVFVTAAFRLEIIAPEPDAEALLARGLSIESDGAPVEASLVRNYTQDEADVLLAQLLAAPESRQSTPLFADLTVDEVERRLEIRRDRNRAVSEWMRRASADEKRRMRDAIRSERLSGPAELAPSYEAQIDLSNAGASHTVTVPVERLAAFLARMQSERGDVDVRLLTGDSDAATSAASAWVDQMPELLRWWTQLRATATDAHFVVIPIVIDRR